MPTKWFYHLFFIFFIAINTTPSLFGWSSGHDHVNAFAIDILPVEIKEFLGKDNCKKVVMWSHAPDDFTPWEKLEKKYTPFTEEEKELIKKHKLKHIYTLHSHIGQAVNLILLTQAFKDNAPNRAALWAACLLHTYADEAACNHDPLIHFMTYSLSQGYKMKFNKGVGFDFGNIAKTSKGKKLVLDILKNYKPSVISEDPEKALLKIMMGALESNSFMTQRGRLIAASYAKYASPETWQKGQKAMAELGCYGIEQGVNAIVTAWEFAKQNKEVALTPDILKQYHKISKQFIENRPIANDSLFTEFVKLPIPDKPYVGFLIEPSISMAASKLSTASKVIFSSAMLSMQKAGRPFRAIDYRILKNQALPTPKQMPILVINTKRSFNLSKTIKAKIQAYSKAGGKLLWIGGTHGNMLGEFSNHMQKEDSKNLPVSNKYGKNNSHIVAKSMITFNGPLKAVMGNKQYKFTHDPETRAGWMKPACDIVIKKEKDNKNIEILAKLQVDDKTYNIAGAWLNKENNIKYIFLPEYLVSPFLFADTNTVDDPANIPLDDFTKKLFFGCLDSLSK